MGVFMGGGAAIGSITEKQVIKERGGIAKYGLT